MAVCRDYNARGDLRQPANISCALSRRYLLDLAVGAGGGMHEGFGRWGRRRSGTVHTSVVGGKIEILGWIGA